MLKNVVNMRDLFLSTVLILFAANLDLCFAQLIIVRVPASNGVGSEIVKAKIRIREGTNLSLTCMLYNQTSFYNQDNLFWGRKSTNFMFKNEADLRRLASERPSYLRDSLHYPNATYPSYVKNFLPIRSSDAGVYFCTSLNNSLFKSIYIEVNEQTCLPNKFMCTDTHHCISLHYTCDGKSDCPDRSDESFSLCKGSPCRGKISCLDGRCIPTSWCCNKKTDANCTVNNRPTCCPKIIDPYDPLNHYNSNNRHNEDHVEVERKGASSRYVFIIICIISGIFSFVIFLCIISKMCQLDRSPSMRIQDRRNQNISCNHSDCVMRRQTSPNFPCIYLTTVNNLQSGGSNNNNGADDPLISMTYLGANDQPPPYAEVVKLPISISKFGIEDDSICPPPPSYASTNIFLETDVFNNTNNTGASENQLEIRTVNASTNNRNFICDNLNTSGRT